MPINQLNIMRHFARHSVLLRKNPAILPRVAKGYFRALVLGKDVLRTVEFAVTADCNVNCGMCYARRIHDPEKSPLKAEEYGAIWKQARKMGAFSVILSGGEPLLRDDLPAIIRAMEPGKTLFALVTNATLLDRERLEAIRRAGVRVLHLSLNSTDPEQNDRERDWPGHHDKVLSTMTQAKDLGFEVCLSTVVSHGRLDRMEELNRFARTKGVGVVFSLACAMGNWARARDRLLTLDEWNRVNAFMKKNPHVRSDWTINFSLKRECPGGREKIAVSPYGDVMGCGMNLISHGNLREEPLKAIWDRMRAWGPFAARPEKCLIAVDPEYLERYLFPVAQNPVLPVPLRQHPLYPEG